MFRHHFFQPETFKSSQFRIRTSKKGKLFQDNNKYQNAEIYQNENDLNQESNKRNYYQYSNDFEQKNNEQLNDPKIFDGKKNFFSNNENSEFGSFNSFTLTAFFIWTTKHMICKCSNIKILISHLIIY